MNNFVLFRASVIDLPFNNTDETLWKIICRPFQRCMVLGGVAPTPNELRYLEKVSTNKYIVLNKYTGKVADKKFPTAVI